MGLFKPKWKHNDPDVRYWAVKKLEDQNLLAEIAKNDKDEDVRKAAVEQLEYHDLYAEISKKKIADHQGVVTCERCKQEAEGKNYPFYLIARISSDFETSGRSDGLPGTEHRWNERKLLVDELSVPLCNRCIKRQLKRTRLIILIITGISLSVGLGSCFNMVSRLSESSFWVGLVAMVFAILFFLIFQSELKKEPSNLAKDIVRWIRSDEINDRKKELKKSLAKTNPKDCLLSVELE